MKANSNHNLDRMVDSKFLKTQPADTYHEQQVRKAMVEAGIPKSDMVRVLDKLTDQKGG